ncbi:MAG: hypothetical protein RI826_03795 [Chlorobium phaeovibrioides]|nr:hypothetical protein [Chlorobium phaeovibrioides]
MMVLFFGFWKNGYDGNQNRALYIHAMNGSLGARLVSKLFICKLMIFFEPDKWNIRAKQWLFNVLGVLWVPSAETGGELFNLSCGL